MPEAIKETERVRGSALPPLSKTFDKKLELDQPRDFSNVPVSTVPVIIPTPEPIIIEIPAQEYEDIDYYDDDDDF